MNSCNRNYWRELQSRLFHLQREMELGRSRTRNLSFYLSSPLRSLQKASAWEGKKYTDTETGRKTWGTKYCWWIRFYTNGLIRSHTHVHSPRPSFIRLPPGGLAFFPLTAAHTLTLSDNEIHTLSCSLKTWSSGIKTRASNGQLVLVNADRKKELKGKRLIWVDRELKRCGHIVEIKS